MKFASIIDKTYELTDTIKQSETYLSYLDYEKKVLEDDSLKQLLIVFHKNKAKFEESYEYKDYYPGIDEIKMNYQQSKMELMNHQLFKSFQIYEKKVNLYITEIEHKLKEVVNIKDKHGKINVNFL